VVGQRVLGGGQVQVSGAAAEARPQFTHSAFLYDTDTAYGTTLAAFVRDGLARDESVAVAANARHTGLLRDALAGDAAEVRFLAAEEWYVRPVRTIAGWSQLLRAAAANGRPYMRLVGHTPLAHGARTWVRFESALNRSLAGLRGHLLCPYDRSALPPEAIRTAARTHPLLYDGDCRDSAGYEAPERLLSELPEPPYPVTGVPVIAVPVRDTVADLRALVRARAAAEGWLPPDRMESLLLALSELATNGIRHGGEQRELRVWLTDDAVVCEVTDDGPVPPSPLAGYLPPRAGGIGGMGLWLVQQLCDAMAIRSVDGLTHARFALRRSPA
jgi:anti-sigma regulatory factor (Ser/Thr protein kinase)